MRKHIYIKSAYVWIFAMTIVAMSVVPQLSYAAGNPDREIWYENDAIVKESGKVYKKLQNRRALVGKNCMINRVYGMVSVGSWQNNTGYLTDEDITNIAEFPAIANVTLATNPIVGVRDLSRYYAGGTEAGFCVVQSSNASALTLKLLQAGYFIRFYKDGELVSTQRAEQTKSADLLNLSLINIPGTDDVCFNISAVAPIDCVFDEVALVPSTGVEADVATTLKLRYAFVGKSNDIYLIEGSNRADGRKTLAEYKDGHYDLWANNLKHSSLTNLYGDITDSDLGNGTVVAAVLGVGIRGQAYINFTPTSSHTPAGEETFPAGYTIAFNYSDASVLSLPVGSWTKITLYDKNWNEVQTERFDASVLQLGLVKGSNITIQAEAKADFSIAKISFHTVLGLDLGGLQVNYAYVVPSVDIEHHCNILPTVNTEICSDQETFQLQGNNDLELVWEATSCPDGATMPTVNPTTGFVSFAPGSPDGEYRFRATSMCGKNLDTNDETYPNCHSYVTVTKGIYQDPDADDCENIMVNIDGEEPEYEILHRAGGGSLISVDAKAKDQENLIDNNINNYAYMETEASLIDVLYVTGIKKTNGLIMDGSDESLYPKSEYYTSGKATGSQRKAKKVGFVIDYSSTGLDLSAVQAFNIRCYNNGEMVYSSLITESKGVSLDLIGTESAEIGRFSISVPAYDGDGNPIQFDSFGLWMVGVANIDLGSILKIYYAFEGTGDESSVCNDPLGCGSIGISNYETDAYVLSGGATINEDATQIVNGVSAGGAITDLSNFVDYDPHRETAMTVATTVGVGNYYTIAINMGRTLDYRHQLAILKDNNTYVTDITAGTVLKVATYYRGEPTGEEKTDWNVLGADVIGYNEKQMILMQPKKKYDEIRLTLYGTVSVADYHKFYGIYLRNDVDNDGIPDCLDDDSCSPRADITADKVCETGSITLDGIWTGQGISDGNVVSPVLIKMPDQTSEVIEAKVGGESRLYAMDITGDALMNPANAGIMVPTTQSGRFVGHVYKAKRDENGYIKVGGKYVVDEDAEMNTFEYTVYPLQSTWKTDASSTDWNDWNNWTDGSPWLCTDVLIPSNAAKYPVLNSKMYTDGAEYPCQDIHFEPGAAIEYVHRLNYRHAWVDLQIEANRNYLVAAALKEMYTGDMFVPAGEYNFGGNDYDINYAWTELDATSAPQNRFSPAAYQRVWNNTKTNYIYEGGVATASTINLATTNWSHAFNYLKYDFKLGTGTSLMLLPEDSNDDTFIVRLPKAHTSYNYYDYATHNVVSGQTETLTRTTTGGIKQWHRFITETSSGSDFNKYGYTRKMYANETMPLDFTTEAMASAGNLFLVGNPFMSHINISEFMKANDNIVSEIRLYDGNTVNTIVSVDGELLNSANVAEGIETIRPMEAFFVKQVSKRIVENGDEITEENVPDATSITLKLTESMMGNEIGTTTRRVKGNLPIKKTPIIYINAECDDLRVGAMLTGKADCKSETMFDDEFKPKFALFTIDSATAYDIAPFGDRNIIPIGLYLDGSRNISFDFTVRGNISADEYMFVDGTTGKYYHIDENPVIRVDGTSLNRFYLVRGDATYVENMLAEIRDNVSISFAGNMLTVVSAKSDITGVEILDYDGRVCKSTKANATTDRMSTVVEQRIGIVRVYRKDKPALAMKFIK